MTSFSVFLRVMSTFQSCEPNCANEIVLPQKYFPIVRMPNELVFSLALWRQGVFTRFSELSNLILRESASVMSQKWFIHIDTIALIATQELLWAPMRLGICGVECCEESFFWCYNSSQVALKLCVSRSGTSLLQSNVWKKFTHHVFQTPCEPSQLSDLVWLLCGNTSEEGKVASHLRRRRALTASQTSMSEALRKLHFDWRGGSCRWSMVRVWLSCRWCWSLTLSIDFGILHKPAVRHHHQRKHECNYTFSHRQ